MQVLHIFQRPLIQPNYCEKKKLVVLIKYTIMYVSTAYVSLLLCDKHKVLHYMNTVLCTSYELYATPLSISNTQADISLQCMAMKW